MVAGALFQAKCYPPWEPESHLRKKMNKLLKVTLLYKPLDNAGAAQEKVFCILKEFNSRRSTKAIYGE